MQNPKYFVFEGPDGSGKSTLSKMFIDALVPFCSVASCAFPTKLTAPGKLIRQQFAGEVEISERAMGYLMLADMVDYEPVIREALATRYVVSDRHTLISGTVYQTEVFGLDEILAIQQRQQFTPPDRVFILDVPTAVSAARLSERTEKRNELYEKVDPTFQERIRQKYLAYAIHHPHQCTILDGTRPLEENLARCLTWVARV